MAFEGQIIFLHIHGNNMFLSHDADSVYNDTIAFGMLRWLFIEIYDFWCHWCHMKPTPVLASSHNTATGASSVT